MPRRTLRILKERPMVPTALMAHTRGLESINYPFDSQLDDEKFA